MAELLSQALSKKRETRLSFAKKEANMKKALEEEQARVSELEKKSTYL